jgi:hypothetical protein
LRELDLQGPQPAVEHESPALVVVTRHLNVCPGPR